MKQDTIEIRRLEVVAHIGVPEDERATPQKLWISVTLYPSQGFTGLHDKVENTIDYHEVSLKVAEIASSHPRHLIETLATDTAEALFGFYPLETVEITVEKRILPNADFVAVTIERSRGL